MSASADRWWGRDKAGDVEQYVFHPEPPPCGTVEEASAPQDASTDIVGLSVRHERDTVELRAYMRNLTGWHDRWFNFSLKTDHRVYAILIGRDPARYSGQPTLWDASDPLHGPNECGSYSMMLAGVHCPDLRMSRSTERDFVSVIVPRSCLDSPQWVRAGASNRRTVNDRSRTDSWGPAAMDGHAQSLIGPLGPRVRHSR